MKAACELIQYLTYSKQVNSPSMRAHHWTAY